MSAPRGVVTARIRAWADARRAPINPLTAMAAGIAATGGTRHD